MIKTIKTTKEMNFRELMEYIIQNDVSGDFKCLDGKHGFSVGWNGTFYFDVYRYGDDETYEVEVEEEITEDTLFEHLIVIDTDRNMTKLGSVTIGDIVNNYSYTSKIYALINGELKLVWGA